MGIKKNTFLLKNKATQNFHSAIVNILGSGKLAQTNCGYFPRWCTHSSLIPRSSRLFSHPGDRCDVKIPTHVRLSKSNFHGLPDPPILGQTIDRCIIYLLSISADKKYQRKVSQCNMNHILTNLSNRGTISERNSAFSSASCTLPIGRHFEFHPSET